MTDNQDEIDSPLANTPFLGPREGHLGEAVYFERWRHFLQFGYDDEYSPLERVLGGMLAPNLRRSRVAASLITWLGTNIGQSFICEGRQMRTRGVQYPFVAAFAIENVRRLGVNNGVRLVEVLLAEEHHYGNTGITGRGLVSRVIYTADDLEVLEAACLWLGSTEGERFVHECEAEIRRREAESRPARYLASAVA